MFRKKKELIFGGLSDTSSICVMKSTAPHSGSYNGFLLGRLCGHRWGRPLLGAHVPNGQAALAKRAGRRKREQSAFGQEDGRKRMLRDIWRSSFLLVCCFCLGDLCLALAWALAWAFGDDV